MQNVSMRYKCNKYFIHHCSEIRKETSFLNQQGLCMIVEVRSLRWNPCSALVTVVLLTGSQSGSEHHTERGSLYSYIRIEPYLNDSTRIQPNLNDSIHLFPNVPLHSSQLKFLSFFELLQCGSWLRSCEP